MIQNIKTISFGVYSPEQIEKMSVCLVNNSKKTIEHGTVYDPRMGSTETGRICETCGENAIVCPGHFGHIELFEPIVHPLYCKRVVTFLNCICTKCYKPVVTKEQLMLDGTMETQSDKRFSKIQEKVKKIDFCCQTTHTNDLCKHPISQTKYSPSDGTFYRVDKSKTSTLISVQEICMIFDNVCDEDVRLFGFDPNSFIHATLSSKTCPCYHQLTGRM